MKPGLQVSSPFGEVNFIQYHGKPFSLLLEQVMRKENVDSLAQTQHFSYNSSDCIGVIDPQLVESNLFPFVEGHQPQAPL